jgi:hypothetical protein
MRFLLSIKTVFPKPGGKIHHAAFDAHLIGIDSNYRDAT